MAELIHHFGIDWKLLAAQAINFFVLLFILKRYAFGPVMNILRRRTQEAERGIALTKNAEEKMAQIEKERGEVLQETRKEALALMAHTEEDAKKKKEEIRAQAGKEAEKIIQEARLRAEEEKAQMTEMAYRSAQGLIKDSLARVLGKMEPGERDELLIREALEELRGLQK